MISKEDAIKIATKAVQIQIDSGELSPPVEATFQKAERHEAKLKNRTVYTDIPDRWVVYFKVLYTKFNPSDTEEDYLPVRVDAHTAEVNIITIL